MLVCSFYLPFPTTLLSSSVEGEYHPHTTMFKAPKKRKRPAAVLKTGGSEDDDDVSRSAAVPAATGGARRDDDDEDADDDGSGGDDEGGGTSILAAQRKIQARRDEKKRKRRGVAGVGGVSFAPDDDDGGDIDQQDDDEDAGGRRERKRDKKKKKKKTKQRKRDRKKGSSSGRSGGMGFGGGAVSFNDDDNEEDAADEAYSAMRSNTANIGDSTSIGQDDGDDAKEQDTGSMYDSAALKALKAKQKAYIAPLGEKEDVKKPEQAGDGAQIMGQEHPQQQAHPVSNGANQSLGDGATNFIPLDGSSIVAGDDALAYMEEEEDERDGTADPAKRKDKRTTIGTDRLSNLTGGIGMQEQRNTVLGVDPDRRSSTDIDIDDSGRKWEDEVARRAGLAAGAGGERGGPVSKQQNGEDASQSSPAASLETMRTTISKTMTHLRQRREDLESTHDRRQNELDGVQNELRRQEDDLRDGGMSFEYYQDLRLDIADWVGALRNLSTKVETISSAIREQEVDSCDRRRVRRRQREDDVAAILHSEGLLDSIVGRRIQLDSDSDAAASSVDEFGRDIKSAEVLARERRIVRRRRVRRESSQRTKGEVHNGDVPSDTDADMSDTEIEEQSQRINALDEAMLLAKSEMDEKYTSLEELQKLFLSWAEQHPDDYERCYAKLSLADLAAVLVKADTCTKINMIQSRNSLIRDLFKSELVRTISSFENAEINNGK